VARFRRAFLSISVVARVSRSRWRDAPGRATVSVTIGAPLAPGAADPQVYYPIPRFHRFITRGRDGGVLAGVGSTLSASSRGVALVPPSLNILYLI
jgi:hypothetical protein